MCFIRLATGRVNQPELKMVVILNDHYYITYNTSDKVVPGTATKPSNNKA